MQKNSGSKTEKFDSSQYRKYIWEKEYSTRKALPSSNTNNPSSSLRYFLHDYPNINKDLAVDIGCGNGRNAIFLHNQGFKKIVGYDISEEAIKQGKSEVAKLGLDGSIQLKAQNLSITLDIEDKSADLVIDMMTLHSLSKETRDSCVKEIKRVLKPGGYYLLFTIQADSPSSQELIKKYPGPENNSYRFEVEGDVITEKVFEKTELERIFSPLKLVSYTEFGSNTKAYSGIYSRVYCNALFQNI
ncbi:class I SAM-dependent methyltransferase [Candidatus Dojkabacteria bacterium]|nr:class I SAM-dependent methyltransferase [Candidatus Dojkabacteria bacterium]